MKKSLCSACELAFDCTVQCAPPSLVCSSRPWLPAIQPSFASMNFTSSRSESILDFCGDQFRPPSIVLNIRPAAPTAQPNLSPTKLAELNRGLVSSRTDPICQVIPPSLV